ncbi:MAG TPA: tripartite tricarboxylate transporter TctB family protein [Casimicrobiaceae bacterium]|jgi:hypothetical protein|nr:tripartite tricarboxylate transporter TctB family protein [Casimicrobiaceae bacterium]
MDDNPNASTEHGRGPSRRSAEIATAAIVLLFGLTFLYSSYKLGFRWGSDGPQSGFFPFYVSLFLSIASLVTLIGGIRSKDRRSRERFANWSQLKQVLSVLVPAGLYVLGIQLIGIYVSSAIYIALFMRWLGKYSWLRSVVLGLAVAVASFMMFEVWFQVPLYKGIWDPTAWTGY